MIRRFVTVGVVVCTGLLGAGATREPYRLAASNLCSIKPPSTDDLPPSKDKEPPPWEPAPFTPPPPVAWVELKREAVTATSDAVRDSKLKQADAVLATWLYDQERARDKSGGKAAEAGGPKPPPEVHEMIEIEKFYIEKSFAKVDNGWQKDATAIFNKWGDVRIKAVKREGLATAAAGDPDVPPQAVEAIWISKTLGLLGGNTESRAGDGIFVARAILEAWAPVALPKLREPALAAAQSGAVEPPAELLKIVTAAVRLKGIKASDPGFGALSRQATDKWLATRLDHLSAAGKAIAQSAGATPPPQIEDVLQAHEKLRPLFKKADRKAWDAQIDTAAIQIGRTWADARIAKKKASGEQTAATGAATTPVEVDEIVLFVKENACLGLEKTEWPDKTKNIARKIGVQNLEAYRDNVPCVVLPEHRATLKRLVADLETHGWSPYSADPLTCGWRGTITIHSIDEAARTVEGSGRKADWMIRDDAVFTIAVADSVGDAQVSGSGLSTEETSDPNPDNYPCAFIRVLHREDYKYSGSGRVKVKYTMVGGNGMWMVEVGIPAYDRHVEKSEERHNVQPCDRKPEHTSTVEKRDASVLPFTATEEHLTSLVSAGKKMGALLKGTSKTSFGSRKVIFEWDLARRR